MELEGKVAVVTGGAAGIGKAIATALWRLRGLSLPLPTSIRVWPWKRRRR